MYSGFFAFMERVIPDDLLYGVYGLCMDFCMDFAISVRFIDYLLLVKDKKFSERSKYFLFFLLMDFSKKL